MAVKNVTLEQVNAFNKGTLIEHLGIEITEIGDGRIVGTMPVDERTIQPLGLLHGGASAALIESIGSIGSSLIVDLETEYPVGLEINANHVGGAKSGTVVATAKIVHAGRRTHLWQVDVVQQETGKLVCTGRLTMMIVQKS